MSEIGTYEAILLVASGINLSFALRCLFLNRKLKETIKSMLTIRYDVERYRDEKNGK
jgi:hypothetical protein